MLPADNPDPIDTLCVHLYPTEAKRFGRSVSAEELLRLSLRAARKAKKPLVVGEFGASEEKGPEAARRSFHLLLEAILRTGVPLAALWVYDHASQEGTWNVTVRNGRAYQLKALEEANHRIRSGSPPVISYIQKGYTGLLR